ncbi:MAG TPA: hypothetical protein VN937_22085 [Blastocatellia bacterium]|nr:hypothetical protein [Blastocatellia bacterium]
MSLKLTDREIADLLNERKPLPRDYRSRIQARPKRGHKERELDIVGEDGSEFRLIIRQSIFNPLDFSVILAYRDPGSTQLLRLKRYNGKSHEHSNKLEGGGPFYDFHIHTATEHYQLESGLREDGFAQPTDRYSDLQGAIACMQEDCGFDSPPNSQPSLF